MIDWHELALNPTIRRLSDVLRAEFGVWAGFIDASGRQISLGNATGEPPRLLCERLMVNSMGEEGGVPTTCRASLESWGSRTRDRSRPDPFRTCHAGLGALTLPVLARDEFVGSVYASGFIAAERGEQVASGLRVALSSRELARPDEIEALMQSVPILDRSQRGCVLGLLRAIAQEATQLLSEDEAVAEEIGDRYGDMIGTSPEMARLFKVLRKVARGDSTVLIEGENGTGKELIARAIHQHSRRAAQPFIVLNCAAIPTELIESELFGHKKGAFSGAHRDRVGLFEAANHGTFFLDEIGEMEIALQVKLLRVLQEGTFLPVGDNVYRKVDVRVLCATNRDLRAMVARGTFREDLFYRINVIAVESPPLRHRRQDIPLLAAYFLNKSCHRHDRARKMLTAEATDVLVRHPWPGNVRQLENEIERAVIMTGDTPSIDAGDLSIRSQPSIELRPIDIGSQNQELPDAVERLERQMILEGLRRTGWNKTQTAKELGVSRRNLIRKVAAYELERERE